MGGEETHNTTHNIGVHNDEAPQRNPLQGLKLVSRDGRIRTGDPLTPKPRANGVGRAERPRVPRSEERVSSTPFILRVIW